MAGNDLKTPSAVPAAALQGLASVVSSLIRQERACAGRAPILTTPVNLSGNTFQRIYQLHAQTDYVRFKFRNFYLGGSPAEQSAGRFALKPTVVWDINSGGGGLILPITFGGQKSVLIEKFGEVISDPIPVTPSMLAGSYFGVRSYVACDGAILPVEVTGLAAVGGISEGYQAGDFTETAAASFYGTTNVYSFGPVEVLGYRTPVDAPSVYAGGDSVLMGVGWRSGPTQPYAPGFMGYFATTNQVPLYNAGSSGETVSSALSMTSGSPRRLAATTGYKHGVCEYAINDVIGSDTAATIKANLVSYWTLMKRKGLSTLRQTTLPPKTASTDAWLTVGAQTVAATESKRQAINQWLRAPASAGAGNSALADAAGILDGVIDTGAAVEVNSDGSAITINAATGAISNGSGGFWYVDATTYDSGTFTSGTNGSSGIDTTKSWTSAQWWGYSLLATSGSANGTLRQVANSNATTLFIYDTWSPAPASGDTYRIVKVATLDGTHPSTQGHIRMAAVLQVAQFR